MSPKSRGRGRCHGGAKEDPASYEARRLATIPEAGGVRIPPPRRDDDDGSDGDDEAHRAVDGCGGLGSASAEATIEGGGGGGGGGGGDDGEGKMPAEPESEAEVEADEGGDDNDDDEKKTYPSSSEGLLEGPIYLPRTSNTGAGVGSSSSSSGTGTETDGWELTWPIWHMLSHDERKDLAVRHGFKSIGEFEEYVTLRRAIGDSSEMGAGRGGDGRAYGSEVLYRAEADPRGWGAPTVAERAYDDGVGGGGANGADARDGDDAGGDADADADADDADADDADADDADTSSTISESEEAQLDDSRAKGEGEGAASAATSSSPSEPSSSASSSPSSSHLLAIEHGGLPCTLPDDVNARILTYLDVDFFATLALVSPHWRSFTRTESVYRSICRRIYLRQSHRKALHPHRFGGSYRTMLERRPRVRTGGGLYVLRYAQVKKIQRDMWTEVPVGAVLEAVYYRYMYFHESGRVLYALTSDPPHVVLAKFARKIAGTVEEGEGGGGGSKLSGAAWGRYEVRRRDVTVWASHAWTDVRFELRVVADGDDVEGDVDRGGRHRYRNGTLAFVRHASSSSGNFDPWTSRDLVEYKVPPEGCFTFVPDGRL